MTKNDNLKLIDFEHSLKNIPISNRKYFLTKIFDQTSKFISRLRWKAFLNHKTSMTTQTPPHKVTLANYFPLKDLKAFEDDLFDMIKNSKFNSSNQKTN